MSEENRMVSFRSQRVGWTLLIFTIVFSFTSAVLWNHVDGYFDPGFYRIMAKGGLLLLPAVTLMMTIWELFADDTGVKRKHASHPKVIRFVNWCFWGSIALAICEVVHAGAILKYESSTKEQHSQIAAIGDAQAKIAGAATSAAIESSGKVAKDLNAVGQTRTARRTITEGNGLAQKVTASAQSEFQKSASGLKATTFLPDWYIDGGMYAALPVLALLCFALTMFLARAAQPYIDKNDDGIADYTPEPKPEVPGIKEDWNHLTPPSAQPVTRKTTTVTGSNFYHPGDKQNP